ncbi:MAG: SDR family oxidoreductase [Verrucomicrobiota bacterium]|jgi:3-oxoacyl-[acyl-carrier protein] reductase|nr:SDR family oxidoreductase [Verrucomicrobiota bacterium]
MDLEGRASLVTGASRGVGAATALQLAKAGCQVAINYNQSTDRAESVAARCREVGVEAVLVQGDVAKDAACRAIVQQAVEAFGGLDILINNAGTTRFIDFPDLEAVTDEDWERIFAVNLKGPFQMARAARVALAAGADGVIVNTASIAGMVGAGSSIPYCASKAALINLTLSLARTLGPTIRVNAVAPGFIEGEWLQKGLGEAYEQVKERKAAGTVLGAVSTPEDVAQGILAMVTSPKTTGHTLVIDGGDTIGPRIAQGLK